VRWPWRRVSGRARSALLLAAFLTAAFGPFIAPLTSQPASRIALTAAISEHHTVDTDGYPHGIDRATYKGRLRSDKAPGQPLLAVPVYLVGRAAGAESAAHLRQDANLGAWWVTLWTSFLPFVGLVVLMYLVSSRHTPTIPAMGAALSLGIGTMMLPLSVNLYGAALAGLTAYAAWALLDAAPVASDARLVAIGALAAAAVAMEYEAGIAFAVLTVVALRQVKGRVGWYALGAAGPLAVIAWYDWAAFGKPWRTAHDYYATAAIRHRIVGYELGWKGVDATLFGPHGLVRSSPIVIVALAVMVLVAWAPAVVPRRHALVGLAIVLPYLVLCMVWKGTPALEEPGPRYMIPAIPFLAVPLAVMWDRIWRPALLVALWGAIIAIPASVCFVLLGIGESVWPALPQRLVHREFLPTVWSMGLGNAGIVLYAVSVGIAAVALAGSVWSGSRPEAVEAAPG
jgi:hypothetical protein